MADAEPETKLTGGSVGYYSVRVAHPRNPDQAPYIVECDDVVRALGLTPTEFNEFKAIWRTAAARQGNGKPGRKQLDQAIYDAEKRAFYAQDDLTHYRIQATEAKVRPPSLDEFLRNAGPAVLRDPTNPLTGG